MVKPVNKIKLQLNVLKATDPKNKTAICFLRSALYLQKTFPKMYLQEVQKGERPAPPSILDVEVLNFTILNYI